MPRTSYKVYDNHYPYFITNNIVDWLPVFSVPGIVAIVLDSLLFLQNERKVKLFSYVIMENHIHLITQSNELEKNMRAFKSFTARQIIDYLKSDGHFFYLKKLKDLKLPHHTDSEFQLWHEGYHPKQIVTDDMMIQKIEYIHNNPVRRGYVDRPEDWRYSSARNYLGKQGLIPVTLGR